MLTNIALFIACAPLWLLAGIGAGTFALVLLSFPSAGPLPSSKTFSFQAERRPQLRAARIQVHPSAVMLRPYWPSYGVW
jgi:hypothetical protein